MRAATIIALLFLLMPVGCDSPTKPATTRLETISGTIGDLQREVHLDFATRQTNPYWIIPVAYEQRDYTIAEGILWLNEVTPLTMGFIKEPRGVRMYQYYETEDRCRWSLTLEVKG